MTELQHLTGLWRVSPSDCALGGGASSHQIVSKLSGWLSDGLKKKKNSWTFNVSQLLFVFVVIVTAVGFGGWSELWNIFIHLCHQATSSFYKSIKLRNCSAVLLLVTTALHFGKGVLSCLCHTGNAHPVCTLSSMLDFTHRTRVWNKSQRIFWAQH